MQNIKVLLVSFCVYFSFLFVAQAQKKDTAAIYDLIAKSKTTFAEDPAKAMDMANQAYADASKIGFKTGEANALKTVGIFYFNQQKYVEALDYWNKALAVFQSVKDEAGIANILNNIGAVYLYKGDDAKALEYCINSLKLAEKTGDKTRIMSALTTIGSIYHNKKNPKALDYNLRALAICEELGNKGYLATLMTNLGEIYLDHNDDTKAIYYYKKVIELEKNTIAAAFAYNGLGKTYLHKKDYELAVRNHHTALAIAEKLDDKMQQLRALWGIAKVHEAKGDYGTALIFYQKAETLGKAVDANVDLQDIYKEMSATYAKVSDFTNAYHYKTLYADVKDTLYKVETAQKLGNLQFEFDLFKKQGEVDLLTKEKSLQDVELKRQRLARVALTIGLALILIIAIIIFRNYRIKVKTNKILDSQKAEIEGLLLNILPAEVAHELKTNGQATPRNYDSVSVLFTDFKGFTAIADKMHPQALVEELNTCFKTFDNIIDKYDLEKIKTIGDSYMCAGSIPTTDEQHVYKMVKASLEMQDYIVKNNHRRKEQGLEPWDLRLGIHVGPIVAGVVGKKKYAYDIWGSTVNIASRMESNGAPGKVNVSAAVYEHIKDRFICSHRGKIHAKNVGEIDMYFVEHEVDTSHPVKIMTPSETKETDLNAEVVPE